MSIGGGKRTGRSAYQSIADQNFGVTAHSILPNLNDPNQNMNSKQLSDQFLASGSFLDAKSSQVPATAAGTTTTSDILFLKRLLFLKAALDNDQTVSNFAVPFDEERTFQLGPSDDKQHQMGEITRGISTAPVTIDGKRQRLDPPLSLEDDIEEKPLAITNGGINDDLNDNAQPMKALMPPSGYHQR